MCSFEIYLIPIRIKKTNEEKKSQMFGLVVKPAATTDGMYIRTRFLINFEIGAGI